MSETNDKQDHPHHGHRDRLRRRFEREGLEHFEDHQVLELALFQGRPRQDTNQLAHLLLSRFGSLSGVLDADPRDLAETPGVGATTASFLTLLPALTRRYLHDKAVQSRPCLNSPQAARLQVVPLMAGRVEEVFYLLCLDNAHRLIFPALISRGTVNEAAVHPRHVVRAALSHNAARVILAHNHPSGNPQPSQRDIHLTQLLIQALIPIGIAVDDHLIVHGENASSMAELGVVRFSPSGTATTD
ncbi:MAG: DNA repair protein RadC [Magnetococcus sp. WYHC-3]